MVGDIYNTLPMWPVVERHDDAAGRLPASPLPQLVNHYTTGPSAECF